MAKVLYGQIASVTDLEKLRDKANGAPYLGISKTGQIYVFEGGSHKVIQPEEAIEKTGIDPGFLKKLVANFGIVEDEQPEEVAEEEPQVTPEVTEEETPVPEEQPEPEPTPEVVEVEASEHPFADEPVEEEVEINVTRRVQKRISKLEDLLVKAAEELASLKSEILQ